MTDRAKGDNAMKCHETDGHPGRVKGLPESLAEIIIEWTCEHEEEARAFAAVITASASRIASSSTCETIQRL
jgi:hypothetical protein